MTPRIAWIALALSAGAIGLSACETNATTAPASASAAAPGSATGSGYDRGLTKGVNEGGSVPRDNNASSELPAL